MATMNDYADYSEEERKSEYDRLKASIRGHKSHVTRRTKWTTTSVKALSTPAGDEGMVNSLMEEITSMKKYISDMDDIFKTMTALRPAKQEEVDRSAEEVYDKIDTLENEVLDAIAQYRQRQQVTPRGAPAAANNNNRPTKPEESLKPKILMRSFSPMEYTLWKEEFTAYFNSGDLGRRDIEIQRAQLNVLLDSDMKMALRDKVDARTAIMGRNGCLDALEQEFAGTNSG